MSNYATKTDLKNATGVDTSDFSTKTNLANLKSDVDELDIDKLKNMPNDLICDDDDDDDDDDDELFLWYG